MNMMVTTARVWFQGANDHESQRSEGGENDMCMPASKKYRVSRSVTSANSSHARRGQRYADHVGCRCARGVEALGSRFHDRYLLSIVKETTVLY
jgi:hypothetical protein